MKKIIALLLAVVLVFALVACAKTAAPAEEKGDGKYKVALSNSFIGNDWRQEMQAAAALAVKDPYYADRVTLDIIDCDNTPEAQTASIDAIVEKGYDILVIDCASSTGVDNALKRAEQAGLTVVEFDSVSDSDDFYKIENDWVYVSEICAKYIAEMCGGKGNYVMDRGLNGNAIAQNLYQPCVDYLTANTDMQLVAEFEGQFAEGPAEQGITAAMTANPQIDAVFSQGYIACIARAFRNAGKAIPVITGNGMNGTGIDVVENGDYNCLQWNCNLAGIGVVAMEMAINIREGKYTGDKHVINRDVSWNATNPDIGSKIGITCQAFEDGKTYFSDKPAGLQWPVFEPDFPVQINIDDLTW